MHDWLKTWKMHWRINKCCSTKETINAKNFTPLITEAWWFKHTKNLKENELCVTHFIYSNRFSPDTKNNSKVKLKHSEDDTCRFLLGLFPHNYVGRSHRIGSSEILSYGKIQERNIGGICFGHHICVISARVSQTAEVQKHTIVWTVHVKHFCEKSKYWWHSHIGRNCIYTWLWFSKIFLCFPLKPAELFIWYAIGTYFSALI